MVKEAKTNRSHQRRHTARALNKSQLIVTTLPHTAFWWIKRLHADFHVNLTENLLTNGTFIGGGPWPTFWAVFLSPDL